MNEQQQKRRDGETEQEYLMRMVFGESECKTCSGSGYIVLPNDYGFITCKVCDGTGR